MSNKPSLKKFIEVNSQAFNIKNRPDGLVYKDEESGQLYKEVNAFRNRLMVETPFAVFAAIMYILSSVLPDLQIWEVGIYIIILCAVFIFLLTFVVLRYYFTKFEVIKNEKDAVGTGYQQVEFAMIIVPAILLFLI